MMFNSQNGCKSSLNELAEDFELNRGKSISKQALDARFTKDTVMFLNQVLSDMLAISFKELQYNNPTGNTFSSCMIRDSTRFRLPDQYVETYKGHGGTTKTKSMISIQYEMDLLSGEHADLQLTSGCRNDQADSKESVSRIRENSLMIRDLGYITSTYLKAVIDRNAYYLNRIPSQMNVYDSDKKLVDFSNLEKKMKRHQLPYMELEAVIGKKAQIPSRVIVSLADEKTARHRLNKTSKNAKSIGCKISKEQKKRSRLNIYITNVPQKVMSTENVLKTYSLRWQIELVFKSWKSHCNIDKLKKVKQSRFECTLIAGLIWIMINWKIFQILNQWLKTKGKEQIVSIWKYFKHVTKNKQSLRSILFNKQSLADWLKRLLILAETKLVRESKKGKLPFNELLKMIIKA